MIFFVFFFRNFIVIYNPQKDFIMKTEKDTAEMQKAEGHDIGNILSAVVLTAGLLALILFAIFR
jgi:hypothetical protein